MNTRPARTFEEVSILATGVQPGKHRFNEGDRDGEETPPVAAWRCNLTALSTVYNLYFVACMEKIYVYQPQFPFQTLSLIPALIIDTHPSSPDISHQAHIDRRNTHAINNMIVQTLGNSEVVAVVRDDGDVDAYFTCHIEQAIERRNQPGNTLSCYGVDVRPLFHQNVDVSAWGLAIHSAARMIAVSSNSNDITVFAFALTQEDADDTDENMADGDWTCYISDSGDRPPLHRRQNDIRLIHNGNTNIPSIAFCNTGHDPSGKWLLSTDITGVTRGWNTHTLSGGGVVSATAYPRMSRNELDGYLPEFDRLNAGWSIMFLNPRSFRNTDSLSEALGLPPDPVNIDVTHETWDASDGVGEVRRNSRRYMCPRSVNVVDGNFLDPLPRTSGSSSRAGGGHSMTLSHRPNQNQNVHPDDGTSEEADQDHEQAMDMADPDDESDLDMAELQDDSDMDTDTEESLNERHNQSHRIGRHAPTQVLFQGPSSLCADLPCPIFQAAVTSTYLFQPSQNGNAEGHTPIITVREPFEQDYHARLGAHTPYFERCNMHAQIPDLGVMLLATQKGRVAILSLTQLTTEAPDPTAPSEVSRKRVYGYRIDHILPFASQEAAGFRPPCPLAGVAVGPMQGTESAPDELKRWRLMIMYQDHSVLSYEIARPAGDRVAVYGGTGVII